MSKVGSKLQASQYAESSFALKRPKMAAALRPRLQELARPWGRTESTLSQHSPLAKLRRTWRSARTFAMRAEGVRFSLLL